MNGKDRLLLDTNIFIYLLEGHENAARLISDKKLYFSFVTEIELLGNHNVNAVQSKMIREMLSFHTRNGYKNAIGEKAIALRKSYKIKVPDAIILASSLVFNIPIITSDKALGKVAGIRCVVFEL